jgi:hypothetical protein
MSSPGTVTTDPDAEDLFGDAALSLFGTEGLLPAVPTEVRYGPIVSKIVRQLSDCHPANQLQTEVSSQLRSQRGKEKHK